jgi:hypothetical protein
MNNIIEVEPLDSTGKTTKKSSAKATSIQKGRTTEQSVLLTGEDKKLFAECESDIEVNLRGTFILGWRLEQIRDKKLYRATHKTFETYCKERWDFSKTHANRHIQAYLCEKHLKTLKYPGIYVPTKESQVRLIADLQPEQWVEVAAKVKEEVGEGNATAANFGSAREELFPKPKRETGEKQESDPGSKGCAVIFDTNLVSMAKIAERVKDIYHIYASSTKKQEGLKMFGELERWIESWVEWEVQKKEAA